MYVCEGGINRYAGERIGRGVWVRKGPGKGARGGLLSEGAGAPPMGRFQRLFDDGQGSAAGMTGRVGYGVT